jgi:ribosome biogenesis protein ENP2
MFEDTDFQVDEEADEFKALHPNAGERARKRAETQELLREHFEQVRALCEL